MTNQHTIPARILLWALALFVLTATTALAQSKDYGAYNPELGKAALSLGNKHALVIGVEYQGADALQWTVDDAVEIGWVLKEKYSFNVTCAITRYPTNAGRKQKAQQLKARVGSEYTNQQGILKLFDELVGDARHPSDQAIVYFSGHGKPDRYSPADGYLIPSNGNLDEPSATLIEMRRFESLSRRIQARHVLFVIDSCYSGITGAFSFKKSLNTPGLEEISRMMGSKARQILTAGKTDQTASMFAFPSGTIMLNLMMTSTGPREG